MTRDETLAAAIARDWRSSGLDPRLSAMLGYAEKLTLEPGAVREEDLTPLREQGLDDRGILEVVQVTSYFNFVNRLADGLGVSLESEAEE